MLSRCGLLKKLALKLSHPQENWLYKSRRYQKTPSSNQSAGTVVAVSDEIRVDCEVVEVAGYSVDVRLNDLPIVTVLLPMRTIGCICSCKHNINERINE
uniref:Uncharacterized protein n=1 Tax=Glossina palpalis gambiensis TaxID=67801 RepID=A0A1B0BH28_9MUSC